MNKIKPPKPTRKELERKLTEALAGHPHRCYFASDGLERTALKHMMGSGVIITVTAIGGQDLVGPVLIRDGLSDETIAAIKADLKRSYDTATMYKL